MKKILILLAAVAMFSCEKEINTNGQRGDNGSMTISIQIANWNEHPKASMVKKIKVEGERPYFDDNTILAEANWNNGNCKMTLPAKLEGGVSVWETSLVDQGPNVNVSDPNANIIILSNFYLYDDNNARIVTVSRETSRVDFTSEQIHWVYADRNFTIKGYVHGPQTAGSFQYNYDLNFKKGWNIMYKKEVGMALENGLILSVEFFYTSKSTSRLPFAWTFRDYSNT